ncbi:TetR/AcrR family transcriptional regulator [Myxococcus stipitatus]|uniref:TetR/AcrR family transcriptional regulator n=1 Tax=Myxococcus stipitatus TaxID=83455 RepID=UPI001F2D62BF|nr:TetR/AcrR family transcriptional regulator [Myxococcus stipitatus]MCE9670899.1 TetR/AcrR family transcriptional regulator [Myxococcus stipitatus]
MKKVAAPQPRSRGRPREFDETKALDRALEVFWRLGYEGASVADLTQAMGITPPSLYGAFGSKAGLYERALARYQSEQGAYTRRILEEEPTARGALERLLRESARNFTRRKHATGCMISTAVLRCAEENQPVADLVAGLRGEALGALEARVARGIQEGELPPGTDAESLARFVGALIQGMSVQAQDGATEAQLVGLVEVALRAWTGGGGRPRAGG